MAEIQFTPIQPYDVTYGENHSFYDSVTYRKNNDKCNVSTVMMESGNICRYYQCKVVEPCRIGGD